MLRATGVSGGGRVAVYLQVASGFDVFFESGSRIGYSEPTNGIDAFGRFKLMTGSFALSLGVRGRM